MPDMTEFFLIRHAPAAEKNVLSGRRDPAACLPDQRPDPALLALFSGAQRISSPAQRCRQTAAWLWPQDPAPATDPALWEQDFGAWEGQPYSALPDLGALSRAELAAHCPPGGESFAGLVHRVQGWLARQDSGAGGQGQVLTVHAGVIRAFLGLALGDPAAGLAFQIEPLSLTRLTRAGGAWSIGAVNLPLLRCGSERRHEL